MGAPKHTLAPCRQLCCMCAQLLCPHGPVDRMVYMRRSGPLQAAARFQPVSIFISGGLRKKLGGVGVQHAMIPQDWRAGAQRPACRWPRSAQSRRGRWSAWTRSRPSWSACARPRAPPPTPPSRRRCAAAACAWRRPWTSRTPLPPPPRLTTPAAPATRTAARRTPTWSCWRAARAAAAAGQTAAPAGARPRRRRWAAGACRSGARPRTRAPAAAGAAAPAPTRRPTPRCGSHRRGRARRCARRRPRWPPRLCPWAARPWRWAATLPRPAPGRVAWPASGAPAAAPQPCAARGRPARHPARRRGRSAAAARRASAAARSAWCWAWRRAPGPRVRRWAAWRGRAA